MPGVATGETRKALWYKSRLSFLKTIEEADNYDWFIRGDDDTYMVCLCLVRYFRPMVTGVHVQLMDNVATFLAQHDPAEKHYFGRHFKIESSVKWTL